MLRKAAFLIVTLALVFSVSSCGTSQEKRPMTEAWYSALVWLKDNTPEPAPNDPETAYTVMSWWDYGDWITSVANRTPVAKQTQEGATIAGTYLISQDETSANQIMDELGAKYVVIDNLMAYNFIYPFVAWASRNETYHYNINDFYEVYYVPTEGGALEPVRLLYPVYYNSIVVRLFNFDGQAVVPAANDTVVISYQERADSKGNQYKAMTSWMPYPSYPEAEKFISEHPDGNYRIVGVDPTKSPVPLAKAEHYNLTYTAPGGTVKIFNYTK